MSIAEKQELFRLLTLYQLEIIEKNKVNVANKHKSKSKADCNLDPHVCELKALYEHARIIGQKLAIDIGEHIMANWEMWGRT